MTTITLHTEIQAPIELVFDTSRDIGVHLKSASKTKERAIGGVTEGFIELGESVTWRGKHFGLWLEHTSKIIEFERPRHFTDVMTKGHFNYFIHSHYFETTSNGTRVIDVLTYKVPYGHIGKMIDLLVIRRHLTEFLKERNAFLKNHIEITQL